MRHYLVTGCAGFIGYHLCKTLLQRGDTVLGVDDVNDVYDPDIKWRRIYNLDNMSYGFTFVQRSILDPDVEFAFSKSVKTVFHLAALAGIPSSYKHPDKYHEVNREGTNKMLVMAVRNGVRNFVQASTSSIYAVTDVPSVEGSKEFPVSPYAASKWEAERLCESFTPLFDKIAIFRFFTVYGPYGRPDMSLFRFVQGIREGRPITVYGDGSQERGFTYISDVVKGTILADFLDFRGSETFNLGGHRGVSIMDAIRLIEAKFGLEAIIQYKPLPQGDRMASLADTTKARKILGWYPEVKFEDGLETLCSWYERERHWAQFIRTDRNDNSLSDGAISP